MCADGWDNSKFAKEVLECPDCGAETDEDGDALYGCNYAREYCPTCGHGPCDQGC